MAVRRSRRRRDRAGAGRVHAVRRRRRLGPALLGAPDPRRHSPAGGSARGRDRRGVDPATRARLGLTADLQGIRGR